MICLIRGVAPGDVVPLDRAEPAVAEVGQVGQPDPPARGRLDRIERVVEERPGAGGGRVAPDAHEAGRVGLPLALEGHVDLLVDAAAHRHDALEAEADLVVGDVGGQEDLLLDRTGGVEPEQAVRRRRRGGVTGALARDPEAAVVAGGDTLEVVVDRRPGQRHRDHRGDAGRRLGGVDDVDLRALVDRVLHGVQRVRVRAVGREAGHRAPADGHARARVGRGQHRVRRRRCAEAVDADRRRDVGAGVALVGGDEEAAGRDRVQPLGSVAGGEHLAELRGAAVAPGPVHAHVAAPLGADEEERPLAVPSDLEALRLDALRVRSLVVVVAVAHPDHLEAVAAVVAHAPVGLKMVKLRLPPSRSPSLATAMSLLVIHCTVSGSRGSVTVRPGR